MKHPRVLMVFYSATGHTRALADEIAAELGATIVQITCPSLDRGSFLTLRRLWSALTQSKPDIRVSSQEAVEAYDLVVIGGPIWAARLATPLSSYIEQVARRLPDSTGAFISSGTKETADAVRQWSARAGRQPVATLCICDDDRVTGRHIALIQEYTEKLKDYLANNRQVAGASVSV